MARAKGDGTLSWDEKRGHWWVIVTYQDTNSGESKRKWLKGTAENTPKGKSASLKIGQKWLEQIENGLLPEADKVTLWQWLERWLQDYLKPSVRSKSYDKGESCLRLYIKPYLGDKNMMKLKAPDIQRVFNQLLIDGGKAKQEEVDGKIITKKAGLSTATVRLVRRYLIQAMDKAVKLGLLLRNVAKYTEPPKLRKKPINPLNKEQAAALAAVANEAAKKADQEYAVKAAAAAEKAAQGGKQVTVPMANIVYHSAYMAILLALNTGMRLGEVFGLSWDSIDLKKGIVYVRRELVTNRKKTDKYFEEPKTAKSRRQIPLTADVATELRKYKKLQDWHKNLLGDLWQNEDQNKDLVITNQFGAILDTGNFTQRYFKPYLKAAGILASVKFHDLRHTHATLLLVQGVNPKIVSERLGHSTVTMTLDTYSHLLPDMQDTAVAALEGIFTSKIKA